MKILKVALISTAFAFAPAAYAQVVDQPVETEEQAPETDTADMAEPAPETDTADTAEPAPEPTPADEPTSAPMNR